MANIPTLPTRLPGVGVPVARLRLPTPTAGGAASLARVGGLIAEIGLRNRQAERTNDLNEGKLRILQTTDEATQAADAAKAGRQIETFTSFFGGLREQFAQGEDEEVNDALLLNLEATLTRMLPQLRLMESRKLGAQAQTHRIETRASLIALATVGTNLDFEAAIGQWRTLIEGQRANLAISDPAAADEIVRFEGEALQNRAIELASTDPEAALALLKSPRAIENLTAASRVSIRRAVEAKRQEALTENAATFFENARRRMDSLALDEHFDPVQYNTEATRLANELASIETVTATADEIKLGLLQNAMDNAAQTGNWALVQRLKPAVIDTLEGQTAFDKIENAALAIIHRETSNTILQTAADGQTTVEELRDLTATLGLNWVNNPKDPNGLSPDRATALFNRASSLLDNKTNEDAIGVMYRMNLLLLGAGTKATQKVVDQEAGPMLEDIMQRRDLNLQDPNDVILAKGVLMEATKVTGVFPTVITQELEAGARSPDRIDRAADLAEQAQTSAPATYKRVISPDARAMLKEYRLIKSPAVSVEEVFKSASQTVFDVKPARAAALVNVRKSLRDDGLTSLLNLLNEERDLDIGVKEVVEKRFDPSDQISAEDIAIHIEVLEGAFLRTGNRPGGIKRAIDQANEIFFRTHGVTRIDSQPRVMSLPPEGLNVYGQAGWGPDEMQTELAENLIEVHLAGTLMVPETILTPGEPARKIPTPTPHGGVPAIPFFIRSDEQMQIERIRLWREWIKENVILEPNTLNVKRTPFGLKPSYSVMVVDKKGTASALNISRGEMAPEPLIVDFEYQTSRLLARRVIESIEEAREALRRRTSKNELQRRLNETRGRFGLFPIF